MSVPAKPEIHIAPTRRLQNILSQIHRILNAEEIGTDTTLEVLLGMVGYALLNQEITKAFGKEEGKYIDALKAELQRRLETESVHQQDIRDAFARLSGNPVSRRLKNLNANLNSLDIIDLERVYSELRTRLSEGKTNLADKFWEVRTLVQRKCVESGLVIGLNHDLEDLREQWKEQRRIHLAAQQSMSGDGLPVDKGIKIDQSLSLYELVLLKACMVSGEEDEIGEETRQQLGVVRLLAMLKAANAEDWFEAGCGFVLARSIEPLIFDNGTPEAEDEIRRMIDDYLSSEDAEDPDLESLTLKFKLLQHSRYSGVYHDENISEVIADEKEDLEYDYRKYVIKFLQTSEEDIYGDDMMAFMLTGSDGWDFPQNYRVPEKIAVILVEWLNSGSDPTYIAALTTLLLTDRKYTDYLLHRCLASLPKPSTAHTLLSAYLLSANTAAYFSDLDSDIPLVPSLN